MNRKGLGIAVPHFLSPEKEVGKRIRRSQGAMSRGIANKVTIPTTTPLTRDLTHVAVFTISEEPLSSCDGRFGSLLPLSAGVGVVETHYFGPSTVSPAHGKT